MKGNDNITAIKEADVSHRAYEEEEEPSHCYTFYTYMFYTYCFINIR
jgi:hypothetical protein